EFFALLRSARENGKQGVGAAGFTLFGSGGVIRIGEKSFVAKSGGIDCKEAGKFEAEQSLAGALSTQTDSCLTGNRIVLIDGSVDFVMQGAKSGWKRSGSRQAVRAPDVIKVGAIGFFALPEHFCFVADFVIDKVE